jgi:hypothetical protein
LAGKLFHPWKGEMIRFERVPMSSKNIEERPHLFRQAMQAPLSVILCTHNPRPDYLSRVLASLRGQTLPAEQWEFLLIDNASRQPLTE